MNLWKTSIRIRWLGAGLTCFILFVASAYAYEVPGGMADWRYSRAIGNSGTLSIPTGRTPEEAVQKFRSRSMQLIHRETVDGGVLLFFKSYEQTEDSTNLQIEFVRKLWLGWKWVMGGGYGISSRSDWDEALNYKSMPKYKGIHGPFPIVVGYVINSTITSITVSIGGVDAGKYNAKLIENGGGQRLWYVALPTSAEAPYEIEAFNGEGTKVAIRSFDHPHDVANVFMSK